MMDTIRIQSTEDRIKLVKDAPVVGDTSKKPVEAPVKKEEAPVKKDEGNSDTAKKAHKFEAPSSWNKEEQDDFYTYDEKIQERISRDSKNLQGMATKKMQELADKLKAIEGVDVEKFRQLELISSYVASDAKLAERFQSMIKSHHDAKVAGKPWKWEQPEDGDAAFAELDEFEKMEGDELVQGYEKGIKSFAKAIKSLSKQNKDLVQIIESMKGEFLSRLEPFERQKQVDEETKTLLKSLSKEQQMPEFTTRLDALIAETPEYKDKPLAEVFPLAVEKLTGILSAEKAKEEGAEEAEAKLKLEQEKHELAGPGGSKVAAGGGNDPFVDRLTERMKQRSSPGSFLKKKE